MIHAALWNLITAPELAILLSQGGTLPTYCEDRRQRMEAARRLLSGVDMIPDSLGIFVTNEAMEEIRKFEDVTAERVTEMEKIEQAAKDHMVKVAAKYKREWQALKKVAMAA